MKQLNGNPSLALVIMFSMVLTLASAEAIADNTSNVSYRTVTIENVDIFYREAGNPDNPTLLLLHGFPTSSHMFRDLITELSDDYHLVAPDYPGYGYSSMPAVDEFDYSFDNIARLMGKFVDKIDLIASACTSWTTAHRSAFALPPASPSESSR